MEIICQIYLFLEPLSKELEISLNELLAGETIEKENAMVYMEQNILDTIDYTDKKMKYEHKKIYYVYHSSWYSRLYLCL